MGQNPYDPLKNAQGIRPVESDHALRGLFRAIRGEREGWIPESTVAEAGIDAVDPMAGITMYPSRTIREAATRQFVTDAAATHPTLQEAAERFATRYPRIAAHTRVEAIPTPAGASMTKAAQVDWNHLPEPVLPGASVGGRIPLQILPRGAQELETVPTFADEILSHEGTHVAQRLGNRETPRLYDTASRLVGYPNNPFEASARGELRGSTAIDGLVRLLSQPPETAASGQAVEPLLERLTKALIRSRYPRS
jgi:hypothetical protein